MNCKLIYLSLNMAGIAAFATGSIMTEDVINSKLLISCSIVTTLNAIRILSGKNAKTNQDYEKKASIQTD